MAIVARTLALFAGTSVGLGLLAGCSLIGAPEAPEPHSAQLSVDELFIPIESIKERLGYSWSETEPPKDVTGTSMRLFDESLTEADFIQHWGESCGSAYFAVENGEPPESMFLSRYVDESGEQATLLIQRFASVELATTTTEARNLMASACRAASVTNPSIPFDSGTTTTLEGAEALAMVSPGATQTDFDRSVWIRSADLVIAASSRVSTAEAEQLLQAQLDWIAAIDAAG